MSTITKMDGSSHPTTVGLVTGHGEVGLVHREGYQGPPKALGNVPPGHFHGERRSCAALLLRPAQVMPTDLYGYGPWVNINQPIS